MVTGGAGYIGSHIVQLLCEKNYNVFVLDNFSLGHKSNIDKRVKKVIIGDVRNSEDLEAAFDNEIHAVFHFAAWKAAGESMTNPGKYAENNICGTLTLLNSMVNHNVNKFVFSSSAAVYGSPEYLPIDENHPKNPENYYGYTKLAIEENLKWYSELKGLKFAALRYFNATGYDINGVIKGREKNPANLSPIVMEVVSGERTGMQVYGNDYDTRDGSCIRDYIHVSDLAEAHLLALQYLEEKGENLIVNLGTGNGSSVLEVIESANRITGKNVRYEIIARRPGDPANLVASSDLAYKLLGWKAKYSDMDTIIKSMMPVYF
ncbi:MAG: UDP-glucose 4-epimerase GalE [Bacteroidetes bacterium]|nr:UDP-glucose 4-epimerase GalE [Bacteroidota bacterium]